MTNTTTNQFKHQDHRRIFTRMLAEAGLTEIHGLELLRLVKMCNGAYDQILGEQMRHIAISSPQWRLLMRLLAAEYEDQQSLTPTELARSQRLSKNTVSAHLRTLEEQELIERTIDPDDLRAFRIQLSEEGRRVIRLSLPVHIAFLNSLTTDLTPAEIAQLESLLEKLHHSLLRGAENKCAAPTQSSK